MSIKIVTIGGGNGQSNLLDAFVKNNNKEISLISIVSMSDDGRTTGELMKCFEKELGIHLPPPGDLRRCLFSLSTSIHKKEFEILFETVINFEGKIKSFTISNILEKLSILKELKDIFSEVLLYKLPLKANIKGHKFGNILMASIYYNLNDYDKMLKLMHNFLKVKSKVIPVTIKRAYIKAILGNGDEIKTQDRISNVADYSSGIADLELMDCSIDANHNKQVHEGIIEADYIIIGPGDLYTSIISNFIIGGVKDSIKKTKAKVIYIGNSTNKGGETTGLTHIDFINKIERFLGKNIEYFILNKIKPILSKSEKEKFQNDISIKGGDYLLLSKGEKKELKKKGVKIIEVDLLSKNSFYKHSKEKIIKAINEIIKNEV